MIWCLQYILTVFMFTAATPLTFTKFDQISLLSLHTTIGKSMSGYKGFVTNNNILRRAIYMCMNTITIGRSLKTSFRFILSVTTPLDWYNNDEPNQILVLCIIFTHLIKICNNALSFWWNNLKTLILPALTFPNIRKTN